MILSDLRSLERSCTPAPWPWCRQDTEGVTVGEPIVAWLQPCTFTDMHETQSITLRDCINNGELISVFRDLAPEIIHLISECQRSRPYFTENEDTLVEALEALENKLYRIGR